MAAPYVASYGEIMRAIFCLLSALWPLVVVSTPAKADDWADCKLNVPKLRVAACSRIIEKGGQNPRDLAAAYRFRANAYLRQNEKEKAIADLNAAIRINPENTVFFRGLLNIIDKDYDGAVSNLTEAIKSNPDNAEIYNSRGVAYFRKGDVEHAIADYNEAIRLDPKYGLALSNRGQAYKNKGELEKALADLDEATRLEPYYAVAFYNRAVIFDIKDDIDAGIVEINRAIEIDPRYADAYTQRGWLYGRKSDFDRTIADTSKAIELDGQSSQNYNVRGLAYGSKGELDDALTDFDKAIQINPTLASLYSNRARIYAAKKSFDRAIVDYDVAIKLKDDVPLYYYNRGKIYEQKNNKDRALSDYRKVLDLPAKRKTDSQRQEVARQRIARLTETNRKVTAAPPQAFERVKRVALVIGNGKYSYVSALSNPPNDAKAMAASLRRVGFDYVMELNDLGHEKMGRALKEFGDRAEGAEWAVVFFAGHGIEMNGITYLIPTDAELLRDSHVSDEAFSLTQVQAKVDAASKLGLVILDSCRNNPFTARMVRSAGASRAVGRGLASVEPEGNVLVAYSAKHGTTALDGNGANSPFTEALLKHIEEPGLEINFLFRKVRDDVRSKTQRQQEPFLYGSLSSEPLYFKEAAAK